MSNFISERFDPASLSVFPVFPLIQDSLSRQSEAHSDQPDTSHPKDGIKFSRGMFFALVLELSALLMVYGLWKLAHILF